MKKISRKVMLAALLTVCMLWTAACGGSEGSAGKSGSEKQAESTAALEDVNEIPEDGIITKEQFESVAGEDRQIQFTGKTENGISYVWTFDGNQIQNPQEQNLKVTFKEDGLENVKAAANNASDALQMTMEEDGLICVPTLEVTLPKAWQADTGILVKEQNQKLAKMSDVTIAVKGKGDNAKTTLSMQVTSMDGDCYVVGGVSGGQNDGAVNNSSGSQPDFDSGETNENGGNQDSASGGNVKNNDVVNENAAMTCTISIDCSAILNNMDSLEDGKEEFVPANGQILAPSTVEFEEGETVHDILQRVCKEAGIQMESTFTPAYDSAYVEGINQLYEFDCGELSGWMYSVNGWFPNYGCSKYVVSDGDVIHWVYTCDLGKDVGDNSMRE